MYIGIFLLLISSISNAETIPLDFLYKDKIIDPNCILQSNASRDVKLEECSKHEGKIITSYFVDDGIYGYNFIDPSNQNNRGSIGYKYLGKANNMHVIYAITLGGSLGRLNYINYYKIDKGILSLVKKGPAGDRSFGGISDPKVRYNKLTYNMALTPKLFILNFSRNEYIKPYYEKLPDCAVCQFALVNYENDTIKSVKLGAVLAGENEDPATKCFNKIHQRYIDHNKLQLTKKEADKFVDSFINECVPVKEGKE